MLLRFRFSNFRSFRDEQDLSLVASSFPSQTDGLFHPVGIAEGVLPVVAIYGANASGKTNVLRALQYMADAVRNSHAHWKPDRDIPREPFRTAEGATAPSTFVTDFMLDGVRYQYGFSCNSEAVLEEWLFAYPRGKKQTWFSRKQQGPTTFSSKMPGENRTIEALTRKNSLFLSAAAQNNHEALSPIYTWFSRSLSFVVGLRALVWRPADEILTTPENKDVVARLLSVADLGIADLSLQELPPMPGEVKDFFDAFKTFLKTQLPKNGTEEPDFSSLIEKSRKRLRLLHRLGNSSTAFEQDQESSGTLAFLTLLGSILPALKHGGTVLVDELDASLHPVLAIQLIRLFSDPERNKQAAQLIFNTHDTNLLSGEVLRRDEVWFTEKQLDGASRLYPLTDFKPRREENLENGYLQGRYGAIPFLNPDCLVPFDNRDEEV
jgi:uncharacterized protein